MDMAPGSVIAMNESRTIRIFRVPAAWMFIQTAGTLFSIFEIFAPSLDKNW